MEINGSMESMKFGFTTIDIFRTGEDSFEIHKCSDGWEAVAVDRDTVEALVTGKIGLLDIDFN